jgi:arylsulfatase A-like enzyme
MSHVKTAWSSDLPSFSRSYLAIVLALIGFGYFPALAQPNIIYIMTDDMGYGDLSGYGHKEYTTPNLDKLAAQGIKFVNAYSAGPLCTPTRVAFMTGRYPARTPVGLIEPLTGVKDSAIGLTPEFPSIASLVKTKGYETAIVGKWHLGSQPRHSPNKNGFDYFFGFKSGAADYISHTGYGGQPDLYENDRQISVDGYLTELISQKASEYITKKHSKAFFLIVNYNAPHWPWQAPGDKPYPNKMDFREGGSSQTYAAMMKSLDDGIGELMRAIDAAGISEQTIVIFTNDNGGERYSDNGGLTNSKGTLWEGGIRVPAFVRWPGHIKSNTVTEQVAVTMDWSKTILSIAGAKERKDFPSDGLNLLPLMTGSKKITDRTLYWRTTQRTNQKAIRMEKWKYLRDEKGEYLFDLSNDQQEKSNLRAKYPEVFAKLKDKYADWEQQVLRPVPLDQ